MTNPTDGAWVMLTLASVWSTEELDAAAYPLVAMLGRFGDVSIASVPAGSSWALPVAWAPRRRTLRLDARPTAVVVHLVDDPDHRTTLRHGESLLLATGDQLVSLAHPDPDSTALPRDRMGLRSMVLGEIPLDPRATTCSVAEAITCPGHDLDAAWSTDARARLCGRCATLVHRVTTEAELVHHIAMGHCVAVPELLATLVRVARTDDGVRLVRAMQDAGETTLPFV